MSRCITIKENEVDLNVWGLEVAHALSLRHKSKSYTRLYRIITVLLCYEHLWQSFQHLSYIRLPGPTESPWGSWLAVKRGVASQGFTVTWRG